MEEFIKRSQNHIGKETFLKLVDLLEMHTGKSVYWETYDFMVKDATFIIMLAKSSLIEWLDKLMALEWTTEENKKKTIEIRKVIPSDISGVEAFDQKFREIENYLRSQSVFRQLIEDQKAFSLFLAASIAFEFRNEIVRMATKLASMQVLLKQQNTVCPCCGKS